MRNARAPLLAIVALVLAGCAAPTDGHAPHGAGHEDDGPIYDTGDVPPGGEATLTFSNVGVVALHCHPHPFMEHAVTVTGAPPAPAHVHIVDGADSADFGFEPRDLTVGAGSVVTYHNHGTQVHTVTQHEGAA